MEIVFDPPEAAAACSVSVAEGAERVDPDTIYGDVHVKPYVFRLTVGSGWKFTGWHIVRHAHRESIEGVEDWDWGGAYGNDNPMQPKEPFSFWGYPGRLWCVGGQYYTTNEQDVKTVTVMMRTSTQTHLPVYEYAGNIVCASDGSVIYDD